MPTSTFFTLSEARRGRLVEEAIAEFSAHSFAQASLSNVARRTGIAKGSFYQYFEDKLDLYRWLLTDEVPRRKRAYMAEPPSGLSFWARLTYFVERGMAFLVEHPRLARLAASAADPSASREVRGLHAAICEAADQELEALLAEGVACGELSSKTCPRFAASLVSAVIGPGLTAAILRELDADLHELLASPTLKRRLGPRRRQRLAQEAVRFIREGLAPRIDGKAKGAR